LRRRFSSNALPLISAFKPLFCAFLALFSIDQVGAHLHLPAIFSFNHPVFFFSLDSDAVRRPALSLDDPLSRCASVFLFFFDASLLPFPHLFGAIILGYPPQTQREISSPYSVTQFHVSQVSSLSRPSLWGGGNAVPFFLLLHLYACRRFMRYFSLARLFSGFLSSPNEAVYPCTPDGLSYFTSIPEFSLPVPVEEFSFFP